ncbi:MAG: CzcE family metal-binding protein [Burkholderiaceae bacterium]
MLMATAMLALSSCVTRTSYTDLYGTLVPSTSYADYTISISPETRYVNVEGGEVVRFVADGKSFIWHFMVAQSIDHFDLMEVAPAGVLDHSVIAYVKPDPRYIGVP